MSLVHLADVCSHLQNASKARLGLTSIPCTKLHLRLSLCLYKQGFLSSIQVGGANPPLPQQPVTPSSRDQLERRLAAKPWAAYEYTSASSLQGKASAARAARPASSIPTNPAERRIWLGLKYWNNEPVLSEMKLVSKPTKRISLDEKGLGDVVRGIQSGQVRGLTRPGECLFVTTSRGILEARECVEKRLGGTLLCRAL